MSSTANRRIQIVAPPGQEVVVARMLNPSGLAEGGWTLARTVIERGTICGFYRGAHGEVARITLDHPSIAPAAWQRTERFAVRLHVNSQGDAARLLYHAVLAAVRAA